MNKTYANTYNTVLYKYRSSHNIYKDTNNVEVALILVIRPRIRPREIFLTTFTLLG